MTPDELHQELQGWADLWGTVLNYSEEGSQLWWLTLPDMTGRGTRNFFSWLLEHQGIRMIDGNMRVMCWLEPEQFAPRLINGLMVSHESMMRPAGLRASALAQYTATTATVTIGDGGMGNWTVGVDMAAPGDMYVDDTGRQFVGAYQVGPAAVYRRNNTGAWETA